LGHYELYLNRPISAGHWTTIIYLGDGSEVSYASLPADANGDGLSHPASDMLALINYINEVQTPPYGSYSTDIDHSGATNAQDISRLTDLVNGADTFIPWAWTSLPTNSCEGESAMGGGGGSSAPAFASPGDDTSDNAALAEAFVLFLTTQVPADLQEEDDLGVAAQGIVAVCMNFFSNAELAALADALDDSTLDFATDAGAEAANAVVETIRS